MAANIAMQNLRKDRVFRRNVAVELLDDDGMRQRYRFSNDTLDRLEGLIGNRLVRNTRRSQALTPRQQILFALRYFASGNFMEVIGDTFGVNKGTVSRAVSDVADALCSIKDEYIKFPTDARAKEEAKAGFFDMNGFPCVTGLVDGTHLRILSPPKDQERDYVNRKNYHSINAQVTCDHLGKITSINAAWPGSVHDAHVFRQSNLAYYFERSHQDLNDGILLGDSGYPCLPFLLTPFPNPQRRCEERFNTAHTSTRNLIERVFGAWKRKFHVLHTEMRLKPAKACKIIIACAVLHNLSILWKEPEVDADVEDNDQPPQRNYEGANEGRHIRDHIASAFFLVMLLKTMK